MSMQEKFYWLFGGIGTLLVIASLVGLLLQRRAPNSITIANLVARVNAWWVMVAVLAGCFLLGRNATIVLFAVASLFALREFVTLTPTRPGDHLPAERLVAMGKFVVPLGGLLRGGLQAGESLVVTGATGFFGSAAWRIVQAVSGFPDSDGAKEWGKRAVAAGRAALYLVFAYSAARTALR